MLMCLIEPERLRNPNTGLLPSSPPATYRTPSTYPLALLRPSSRSPRFTVELSSYIGFPATPPPTAVVPQLRDPGQLPTPPAQLPPELPSRHRRQQLAPAFPTARATDPSEIHKQNRTHAVAGSHERMVACLSHPKIEHVSCLRSNLRRKHNS